MPLLAQAVMGLFHGSCLCPCISAHGAVMSGRTRDSRSRSRRCGVVTEILKWMMTACSPRPSPLSTSLPGQKCQRQTDRGEQSLGSPNWAPSRTQLAEPWPKGHGDGGERGWEVTWVRLHAGPASSSLATSLTCVHRRWTGWGSPAPRVPGVEPQIGEHLELRLCPSAQIPGAGEPTLELSPSVLRALGAPFHGHPGIALYPQGQLPPPAAK